MQQLRHLSVCGIASDTLVTLLGALQSMQQLQFLRLYAPSVQALQGEAMQEYAKLTASTQLTQIDLTYDETILADGAAQYMFAEGKQLPHLKILHFGLDDYDGSDLPLPIGKGDLARIAAACPSLEQLWAESGIQPTADLAELALLTSVTQLRVAGWDLDARELSAALTNMTQLVDLQVEYVDDFGTLQLAALTQLTGLRLVYVQVSDDQVLLADRCHPCNVSLHSRVSVHRINIDICLYRLFMLDLAGHHCRRFSCLSIFDRTPTNMTQDAEHKHFDQGANCCLISSGAQNWVDLFAHCLPVAESAVYAAAGLPLTHVVLRAAAVPAGVRARCVAAAARAVPGRQVRRSCHTGAGDAAAEPAARTGAGGLV
jgi:hypothetical protein